MHNVKMYARSCLLLLVLVGIIVCMVQETLCEDRDSIFITPFVGDGGKAHALTVGVPALQASIGAPKGIVQSKSGDLYFTSGTYPAVFKVEFNKKEGTSKVTIVAGTGSMGVGADDILGTLSALKLPFALSLIEDDETGEVTAILIADSGNHRIRKLNMTTQLIHTIAGTGEEGSAGDGDLAVKAQVNNPVGVYYDKKTGDIFITESSGNRIRRIFASNDTIDTAVGKCQGMKSRAIDICLTSPTHFTMNDAGEWFFSSSSSNVIHKVDLDGNMETVAGGGANSAEEGGLATNVQLISLQSFALTPDGELFTVEYSDVRKIDREGFITTVAGGMGTMRIERYFTGYVSTKYDFEPKSIAYTTHGILIGIHQDRIIRLVFECYGVKSDNDTVCSGHGSCTGGNECQCDDGWMGIDCSITHCHGITSNLSSVCSGKGKCVRHNKCHCNDGFRGNKCQHTIE